MTTQDEIKSYKNQLKENENMIRFLTKSNKHIKDHLKYLEAQLPSEKKEEEKGELEYAPN